MVLEIPGFYWDEDKKKYFAIQANHAAPPGSAHSADSVKRKREDQAEQAKRLVLRKKVAKEKITTSTSLGHPLQQLQREVSSRVPSAASLQDRVARAYVSGLELRSLRAFTSWPNTTARASRATALRVLRDQSTGTLVLGGNSGPQSLISICRPEVQSGTWAYSDATESLLLRTSSNLTSLSLDPRGILLSTFDTEGSTGRACLWLHSLGSLALTPKELVMPAYTTPSASAACPSEDKPRFAIGGEGGLLLLEGLADRWELTRKEFSDGDSLPGGVVYRQKVRSVDWMSPTLLACGLRVSKVLLYDRRSGGSASRFQTGRCIDKIRRVDDHRIVVAGQDSLRMFDMRFVSSRAASGLGVEAQPYFTFPGYVSSLYTDLDVSPELNVMATTTRRNDFQLWSLQTGTEIPAPPVASRRYSDRRSPICVAFEGTGDMPNQHGADAPNLLVGSSSTVDQWSW